MFTLAIPCLARERPIVRWWPIFLIGDCPIPSPHNITVHIRFRRDQLIDGLIARGFRSAGKKSLQAIPKGRRNLEYPSIFSWKHGETCLPWGQKTNHWPTQLPSRLVHSWLFLQWANHISLYPKTLDNYIKLVSPDSLIMVVHGE